MRFSHLSFIMLWLSMAFPWAVSQARGGDSYSPLVFDFPALHELASSGLRAEADGNYEVWIWGKGPELAITIGEQKFDAKAPKDRFGWHHPGQVRLEKGQKFAVSFPTNDDETDLMNVPGYLALASLRGPRFSAGQP